MCYHCLKYYIPKATKSTIKYFELIRILICKATQEAGYGNGQWPDRVSKQNTEPGMVIQDSNQSSEDGSRKVGSLRITTEQALGQLGPLSQTQTKPTMSAIDKSTAVSKPGLEDITCSLSKNPGSQTITGVTTKMVKT